MTPPNIVVIMTDQQKATSSHLYGSTFCQTPQLARLAASGVQYQYAITPHPLCVPARISFWTGQWPHAHGGRRNETLMPAAAVHAFKLWHEAGYHCGLIGKNHCFETPADLALFETWCELSHMGLPENPATKGLDWFRPLAGIHAAHALRHTIMQHPQNPRFSYGTSDYPLEDYATGLIAGQTVRFLEQRRHEPFALWVSFPDPHEPWVCPASYAAQFPPEKIDLPPWDETEFDARAPERSRVLYRMLGMADDPLEQVYGLLAVYYGMVRFIDDALGQILDALERLGLRENTIVVFCSDHGDFAGEHRMQCKGGVFYDCLTRVPLVLSWPGRVPAGAVDSSLVNLVDVVPTLLHLQGLEVPRAMQGQPLPLATTAPPRDVTFSEYGCGGPPFTLRDLEQMPPPYGRQTLIDSLRWREAEGRRKMARTRRWKYVYDPLGDKDELYDLERDPWELDNLIDDPQHRDVVADLRLRLLAWMIETEDSPPVPLP
jgi:arylsulfatase A-like enzyme